MNAFARHRNSTLYYLFETFQTTLRESNFIGGEAEAKRVKVTCALMTEPGFDLKSINFVNYKHSGRVLGICYFMPGVLHAYEALIFIITL